MYNNASKTVNFWLAIIKFTSKNWLQIEFSTLGTPHWEPLQLLDYSLDIHIWILVYNCITLSTLPFFGFESVTRPWIFWFFSLWENKQGGKQKGCWGFHGVLESVSSFIMFERTCLRSHGFFFCMSLVWVLEIEDCFSLCCGKSMKKDFKNIQKKKKGSDWNSEQPS